tara:strand:+ start:12343 stop:12993 length:651 start_codon:yes stop_codon:yes gene_type:complete
MIVIFDLDKTITKKDTYLRFIFFFLFFYPQRIFRSYSIILPTIIYFFKLLTDQELKTIFWKNFFKGVEKKSLEEISIKFASRIIEKGLYKDATIEIKKLQKSGHHLILASASLDIYVKQIGKKLKMDKVIATKVEFDDTNKVTGNLKTKNLKGNAKLEKIRDYLNQDKGNKKTIAYSDHISDLPLLKWCDQGVVVNGKKDILIEADKRGFKVLKWK